MNLRFTFHVWGRKAQGGAGVRRGSITADCKAVAVEIARAKFTDPVLDVISDASWQAMTKRAQVAFAGVIAQPVPQSREHPQGDVRTRLCRACGEPMYFYRDGAGNWPKRYAVAHTGRCRIVLNERQRTYRARRHPFPPEVTDGSEV